MIRLFKNENIFKNLFQICTLKTVFSIFKNLFQICTLKTAFSIECLVNSAFIQSPEKKNNYDWLNFQELQLQARLYTRNRPNEKHDEKNRKKRKIEKELWKMYEQRQS
jgi:hypothetical protein